VVNANGQSVRRWPGSRDISFADHSEHASRQAMGQGVNLMERSKVRLIMAKCPVGGDAKGGGSAGYTPETPPAS
jgi:hypothetical protein